MKQFASLTTSSLAFALLGVALSGCSPDSAPSGSSTAGSATSNPARKAGPKATATAERETAIFWTDVTESAGVDFKQNNGHKSGEMFYVEVLMAGVLFFDAEGDGDPDLYLLNGKPMAGEHPGPAPVNQFYRNDGTGHFEDATEFSGLGDGRFSCGTCAGDYDNDGDIDVFVSNFDTANALYENDGQGRFVDVAERAGVTGDPGTPSSSAFADLDQDGLLDLYVGNCVDHTVANNNPCQVTTKAGVERRVYCGPHGYEALTDNLYWNKGGGIFEDVSTSAGIDKASGRTLGVAISDYDNDGDQDIFVTSDRSANLLYENLGEMQFREVGMMSGAALNASGEAQAGMGISTGDYDGDLNIDVSVTYFTNEWNGLYRNVGGLRFRDVAQKARTVPDSLSLMGWGAEMLDVDLDGDLDWMIANGHVNPFVREFIPSQSYRQRNLMFENLGDGVFEGLGKRAGVPFEQARVSRGLAAADIDGDGDLDVVFGNMHGRPELLRNDSKTEGRHWLMIDTVGTQSNRDGIGARIRIDLPGGSQLKEVRSGQSYLSQSELRVHFGLGTEAVVPLLEVMWPSGAKSVLRDVQADQVLQIIEPTASGDTKSD